MFLHVYINFHGVYIFPIRWIIFFVTLKSGIKHLSLALSGTASIMEMYVSPHYV